MARPNVAVGAVAGRRDASLEDSDEPEPDVLAQEIVDDMQALDQFSAVLDGVKR